MANEYRGIADNITIASTLSISASTNTTPIEITCSTSHGLSTGDRVTIYDHATNTNANGTWTITVVNATRFTLDGSTPTAGGGATGTVQPMDLGTYDMPEDLVEDLDAASVNVALEALGDRTAKLAEMSGWDRVLYRGGTSRIEGTVQHLDPQRLSDANHTISAKDGPHVILSTPSGGNRTITVEQATDAPAEGTALEFWLSAPHASNYIEIKREGSAAVIVRIHGTIAATVATGHARIHVESGVWRGTGGHGITVGADW